MNMNLVLATGLVYAFLGALIMYLSHRALYVKASRIVAGYPKVLSALRVQRHDGRLGLIILLCGNALQVLAAFGYTVSPAHWRVPTIAVLSVFLAYAVYRAIASRSVTSPADSAPQTTRTRVRRVYETRRSMILLEAARREAANRRARELAKGPRDRSVIYVGQESECRWWSDRFGVTQATLKEAVRHVGPMVKDVERYLVLQRARRNGYGLAA